MERWKSVVGFEGLYEVSDSGNVRSLPRYDSMGRLHKGKTMCAGVQRNGYLYVTLHKDGKQKHALIHRLVAAAFLGVGGTEVNHLNEDKTDNRLENLEWCDHAHNINYGTGHKRSADKHGRKVAQMDNGGNVIGIFPSVRDAARSVGRGHKDIYNVCNGLRRTSGGYKWVYV